MVRKGIIIVNAYGRPEESVLQAERLRNEFFCLGVSTEIISDDRQSAFNGGVDFAVYLDKDKYFSAQLENAGIRLFNSHSAIRVCDDKGETVLKLTGKVNLPETYFGLLSYSKKDKPDEKYLSFVAERLGYPLVVKESFGSMGKGVYLVKNFRELKKVAEKVKNIPHVFQKYLPFAYGTDVRVIVIGGKAVGAIKRKNENDFRSNVAKGGVAEKYDLDDAFKSTAEKVAEILGLDYCGVDILFGKNGEPTVCEVNSNAFFFGFEKATGINVAGLYAEYVVNTVYGNKNI